MDRRMNSDERCYSSVVALGLCVVKGSDAVALQDCGREQSSNDRGDRPMS